MEDGLWKRKLLVELVLSSVLVGQGRWWLLVEAMVCHGSKERTEPSLFPALVEDVLGGQRALWVSNG